MNKPVAWLRDGDSQLSLVREKDDGYLVWKPIYLHPAKNLTDNEIENLALNFLTDDDELNIYDFAKAILRKAQEK